AKLIDVATVQYRPLYHRGWQPVQPRMYRQPVVVDFRPARTRLQNVAEVLQKTVGYVDGGMRVSGQCSPESHRRSRTLQSRTHVLKARCMGGMMSLKEFQSEMRRTQVARDPEVVTGARGRTGHGILQRDFTHGRDTDDDA